MVMARHRGHRVNDVDKDIRVPKPRHLLLVVSFWRELRLVEHTFGSAKSSPVMHIGSSSLST